MAVFVKIYANLGQCGFNLFPGFSSNGKKLQQICANNFILERSQTNDYDAKAKLLKHKEVFV